MSSESLTIKQERFCQAYIETGNASEAYRRAYATENMKPETVWRTAKELLDTPKVTARIVAHQAAHAERHNVTVDSLTEELDQMIAMAMKNGQPAAGVSAIMGKAKIHGLLAEDRVNVRDPIRDMSDEEIDARIDELKGMD